MVHRLWIIGTAGLLLTLVGCAGDSNDGVVLIEPHYSHVRVEPVVEPLDATTVRGEEVQLTRTP